MRAKYKFVSLPPDFDPVDATVNEVASYRRAPQGRFRLSEGRQGTRNWRGRRRKETPWAAGQASPSFTRAGRGVKWPPKKRRGSRLTDS